MHLRMWERPAACVCVRLLSQQLPTNHVSKLPSPPLLDLQLLRHNSNPAIPGSPIGPPAAVDTSSPFFGRNPFEAPFGELAPKLAPRRTPPPPPGPPMRSLSNQ